MSKLKKVKAGKIKRHNLRKKLGVKQGFGKPWSAPSIMFRVEFNWLKVDESEKNEQINWIECRKLQVEERKFIKSFYEQRNEQWSEGETLESKFVCVYVSKFLTENRERLQINQAFIYPTSKQGNETIRQPIYIVRWTESLAQNLKGNLDLDIVLKNSIYHHKSCS